MMSEYHINNSNFICLNTTFLVLKSKTNHFLKKTNLGRK